MRIRPILSETFFGIRHKNPLKVTFNGYHESTPVPKEKKKCVACDVLCDYDGMPVFASLIYEDGTKETISAKNGGKYFVVKEIDQQGNDVLEAHYDDKGEFITPI